MTNGQGEAQWNVAEWHGKMLLDRNGERIGKLQDVYVDVETDEPQFATVKEGFLGRHLTFVPLGGIQISPDGLQVAVTKEQVRSAPDIEMHGEELSQADESTLYHHFELNYTPIATESGRRLQRSTSSCEHGATKTKSQPTSPLEPSPTGRSSPTSSSGCAMFRYARQWKASSNASGKTEAGASSRNVLRTWLGPTDCSDLLTGTHSSVPRNCGSPGRVGCRQDQGASARP